MRSAATALSEYKLRAANAETRLGELGNDASRSAALSKELKEKQQIIAKLRHEGASAALCSWVVLTRSCRQQRTPHRGSAAAAEEFVR